MSRRSEAPRLVIERSRALRNAGLPIRTGLVDWWRPGGVAQSGGLVDSWTAAGGKSFTGSGGTRPAVGTVGGADVPDFVRASSTALSCATFSLPAPWTVYVVAKLPAAGTASQGVILGRTSGAVDIWRMFSDAPSGTMYFQTLVGGSARLVSLAALTFDVYMVFAVTATAGQTALFINGTKASLGADPGLGTTGTMILGGIALAGYYDDGPISDVAVYSTGHSDGEVSTVTSYLRAARGF